jgi:hypothetical protein
MPPCPSELEVDSYWKVIRKTFQDTPENSESAIEAMFRVLEALNLRLIQFDDEDLENRLAKIEVSRLPETKEWQLHLICYKPCIKNRGEFTATSDSFAKAMLNIFDVVVSDFKTDFDSRTEEANKTERKLRSERESIHKIKEIRKMLGTYVPEQLGLFKNNNPVE